MSTLKDISSLAGVSLATVSRVLNNSASVTESTRQCVENAMRQLHYTPNQAARSLRTKCTKLIGICTEGNTNYMFSHLINYISDYCLEQDYCLIVANHHNDSQREAKILHSMLRQGVDGVIVSLVSKRSSIIPQIISSEIPVVIFDRYLVFDQLSMGEKNYSLVLDNYKAGQLAARHLLELGHRRIAIAEGPSDVGITRMRSSGFHDELAKAGILVDHSFRFKGSFEYEDGQKIAGQILSMDGNRPTAIWAQNDMMAAGIVCEFARAGLRVPEDISVLGMDGIELSKLFHPAITTVAQPFQDMAQTAVQMLLGSVTAENNRMVFEPALCVRESTARVKN